MQLSTWCRSTFQIAIFDTANTGNLSYVKTRLLVRGVNREGFNFKLARVKMCSTWPLLNKYAL